MIRSIRRAGVALAFAFATSGANAIAAPTDDAPTADDILTRAKLAAAADKRPDGERETWTIKLAGLDGTLETLRHGADSTATTDLGPFRTARGVSHGVRWHQNENGETIVERPEPSQAEHLATQTLSRVREPVDAWEIVSTFASGHVQRSFYDPRTYYLIRTERVTAGHTVHTTYEDFRTDARGRVRPWRYFGGDDRPDNDFDYRMTRDDAVVDIADAELAIPHDRRELVEFPAGVDSVKLPVQIANGRIYVRVDIGGRGLDFLLDSGASEITLDDTVARQLQLPVFGRTTQTVAGSFATGRIVVPAATIGPLALHDVVMHTLPFSAVEGKSVRVVGLLGYDFLANVALKIDYAKGEIDAARPGTLAPPAGPRPLDVRFNSGTPVTRATIGNATGDDFIIDTGAKFSYVIFQRFARAHRDALGASTHESFGSGVGGTFGYRPLETTKVMLGTWTFDDPSGVEALEPNAFGFDNEDGLIGANILKRFTIYLDYASGKLFLAPNVRTGVDSALRGPAATSLEKAGADAARRTNSITTSTGDLRGRSPAASAVHH